MAEFSLSDLEKIIRERAHSGDPESWTAKLYARGIDKAAQKLGEEAVETVIAAVQRDKKALVSESADLMYHWLVVLGIAGVPLSDVLKELQSRTGRSGVAEKASRSQGLTAREVGNSMDQLAPTEKYSPYRFFSAEQWSQFRADTPMTLSEDEIRRLRSLNDPVDLEEVKRIYLSLSRLLSAHVEASQLLFRQRQAFFNALDVVKTPFIIGIAGSVAVGKSTTARVLKELLARWPSSPKVDLITTDGFLLPNEILRRDNLMERKGFPDSYDVGALLRFLSGIKSAQRNIRAPVYSHLTYDVIPGEFVTIDRPDILIFEGINVLQPGKLPKDGKIVPFLSDFFDFAIYIDAEEELIHQWYIARFMRLRETAFRNPDSFFHRYSQLSEDSARAIAEGLWANINLKNLRENILPTRARADLILRKGANHLVEEVALRKL